MKPQIEMTEERLAEMLKAMEDSGQPLTSIYYRLLSLKGTLPKRKVS